MRSLNRNDNLRLLIIEDDHALAEVLGHILAPYSRYIAHANRLDKGMVYATHDIFDVIILDLILPPDWSAHKTASFIPLLKGAQPDAGIVVLSGYEPQGEMRKECLAKGADVYISKNESDALGKPLISAVASVVLKQPCGKTETFAHHQEMLRHLSAA